MQVVLPAGTYNVTVEGIITYTDDSGVAETKIGGVQSGLVVNGNELSKSIPIAPKSTSNDLILEEIFFTGSKTPEGQFYFGDQYFKITNNTDQVLYADGMLLIQSSFMTNENRTILLISWEML